MKLKKLLMIPIVGLLLLGSVHTALAAEPVTAEIPVSVEIKDAAELPKAETFTVTLRPVDGAPMPEKAEQEAKLTFAGTGKQSFPAISFDEPGDYRYTLEQEISDTTVCWIDETKYEILVRVFVNDQDNSLYVVFTDATGENKAEEFKFVNSVYEPCIIDPPVLKKVVDENGNVVEDTVGTFTFRLEAIGTDSNTAPMPDDGRGGSKDLVLTGATNYLREGDFGPLYQDSKGTISEFGEIRYFETGTWEYQVSEVSASDGYQVDDEIYNLKMEVTRDDTSHKYVATRTVTTKKQGVVELAEFSFTNKKIPDPPAPTDPTEAPTEPDTQPNGGGSGGGGGGGSRGGSPRSETSNTPTTPGEVLGATRDAAEDVGRGVLGAMRDPGVLGAARNPGVLGAVRTGDSSMMVVWIVVMLLACSAIVGWFTMFVRKRRNS